jgi:hypothetical protein
MSKMTIIGCHGTPFNHKRQTIRADLVGRTRTAGAEITAHEMA